MYSILPLGSDRCAQALDFVCREFVAESPLHFTLKVTFDEYLDYMREPVEEMLGAGLSFVAIDDCSGDLVGCLLAGDFAVPYASSAEIPERVKPIRQLLIDLERGYRNSRTMPTGETLMVDIATVAKMARNQGLYSKLRLCAQQAAKEQGFQRVLGELSSAATQNYCINRLGHKVVAEVLYRTFNYQGAVPFASIVSPASIQLVEGSLVD